MTRKMNEGALKGAGLMVLAGALFACVNVAVQGATMRYGADPAAVVFWQYVVALMVLLPFVDVANAWRVGAWRWHLLRVGFAAIGVQFWVYGLAVVPIWQAIALILMSPLFVTAGAGLFLGERLSLSRWGALLLGIAGGVIVLAPWSEAFGPAALYPILAALFWAASSLVTKHVAGTEGAGDMTLWLLALLLPVNGALAWGGFAVVGWWLVALAGVGTALAQVSLVAAYRSADAAYLQPFDHVKLPFNIGLGYLAFGFAPEGWIWAGVAMIAGAGAWLMWEEGRAIAPAVPRMQDRATS